MILVYICEYFIFCVYYCRMKDEKEKELNNEEFEDITVVSSTEDGDELPKKDIIKKLREEIKKLQQEREEYLTGWQRAKADYINLQKELDSVRRITSENAKEGFLMDLLPAMDSFDMAFQNKEAWESVDKNWRVGVEYIYQQLIKTLNDIGVSKIDSVNIKFDPSLHESIGQVETTEKEKDHFVEKIIQAGYKLGEKVVRPAKVGIYEYKKE